MLYIIVKTTTYLFLEFMFIINKYPNINKDNIPVSEVKKQGAEKVIAINFKAEDINEGSNMMDLAMRTIDIMGNKISEENLEKSDFILTIQTDKTGLLDVEKLDSCYQYGYQAVIENLDKIRGIL